MKRKGFTLVELLVVIAIIALLMGILMPALGMVRKMAQRAVCGANLGGLHKALLSYAQSNNSDYPLAGGRNSLWNATAHWDAKDEINAFVEAPVIIGGKAFYQHGSATIGASLYQLIKYVDVGTKSFICKGDKGAKPFALSDFTSAGGIPSYNKDRIKELRDAWDFGCGSYTNANTRVTQAGGGMLVAQYYSYAYQQPYVPPNLPNDIRPVDVLGTQSDPRLAVLADRSPYLVLSPNINQPAYQFDATPPKDSSTERWGNSTNHENDGQNVLFNDGSVSFNTVPYCGIDGDNIYTIAPTTVTAAEPRQKGTLPGLPRIFSNSMKLSLSDDSLLVNEGRDQGSVGSNR
jgi:prepilin-type N-terminal cleavage/methylation domain-containing protein